MKFSYKLILGFSLAVVLGALLAFPAAAAPTPPGSSGFSIINCGGKANPCTFDDMIRSTVRLINYLMSVAAVVAAFHIVVGGFWIMASLGNPEKLTEKKLAVTHAVVGFAMILLAFAFVNLALGLFGITCSWWAGPFTGDQNSLKCLYGG